MEYSHEHPNKSLHEIRVQAVLRQSEYQSTLHKDELGIYPKSKSY